MNERRPKCKYEPISFPFDGILLLLMSDSFPFTPFHYYCPIFQTTLFLSLVRHDSLLPPFSLHPSIYIPPSSKTTTLHLPPLLPHPVRAGCSCARQRPRTRPAWTRLHGIWRGVVELARPCQCRGRSIWGMNRGRVIVRENEIWKWTVTLKL